MRRVARIAAYLPRGGTDGVPVASVDEDEFTLAATAAERAWSGEHGEPGPVAVHLVGGFPAVADWGFSALLGRATDVVHHAGDAGELTKTIRDIEQGEGGPALVLVAELPERSASRSPKTAPRPAGAVAFRLEVTDEPGAFSFPKIAARRSALEAALKVGEGTRNVPASVVLTGDWDGAAVGGSPVALNPAHALVKVNLDAVSEGAYVPRPRYLENLASRWRFLAETCHACHGTTFPARGVCRRCGRKDTLTTVALPFDGGRVVAVTTVGKGGQPTEFDAQVEALGPYDVALVELARGMRVTVQVADAPPGSVHVGDHVDTRLRRLYPMEGEWRYGRKAIPVAGHLAPTTGT